MSMVSTLEWGRVRYIVNCLQACSRGEKGGDRTKDPAVRALLSEIWRRISDLILSNEVKFILLSLSSTYQGALGKAIAVSWWNPYDLLGFFISVLGPAPTEATKNNYFLPLCAVYARWCSRIAGRVQRGWEWKNRGAGEGDWLLMFNATLRPDLIYFFLGSSSAGDDWHEAQVSQRRNRVQRQQFDTVFASLQIKLFERDTYGQKSSPVQEKNSKGQCYGNCAETYPFLYSIQSIPTKNRSLRGLALERDFMSVESLDTYDPPSEGQGWKNPCGPCDNCARLIAEAGADPRLFSRHWDKRDAPTTAAQIIAPRDELAAAPVPVDVPDGWSNNPEDMKIRYYWGTNGDGTDAAKRVGLTKPQGLLIADPDRRGDRFEVRGMLAQLKLPVGKSSLESKQLHDV
ncbi:hypothetical protein F5Y03DRAFT_383394 [Xylaria venustula]|nr:hypothetical protein F5Y03DRAFT_383394 [Xylaria venustula]